jgi:hypothetical protein
MNLTFDVFTKKTKLYYAAEVISILTALFIAIGYFFNMQFKSIFMPLFDTLLIAGSMVMVGFMVLVGTGLVRTYIKQGELVFGDDYIIIDEVKILLNEAEKLTLAIGIWGPKRVGYVLKNYIVVIDKDGKMHKNRFAVKTRDQSKELDSFLNQWQQNGVSFDLSYNQI